MLGRAKGREDKTPGGDNNRRVEDWHTLFRVAQDFRWLKNSRSEHTAHGGILHGTMLACFGTPYVKPSRGCTQKKQVVLIYLKSFLYF